MSDEPIADVVARVLALDEKATPGRWSWNGYAAVAAPHLFDAETAAIEAAPDDCRWPHRYECTACNSVPLECSPDLIASVCAAPIDLYETDSTVCGVPAHHGDTATGRHQADAEWIASTRTDAVILAREVERLTEEVIELEAGGITLGRYVEMLLADNARLREGIEAAIADPGVHHHYLKAHLRALLAPTAEVER